MMWSHIAFSKHLIDRFSQAKVIQKIINVKSQETHFSTPNFSQLKVFWY